MALPYRIIFHDEADEPLGESVVDLPHDDAAIDLAGAHIHPHPIHIWQGDRFVARIPPWSEVGPF
jgi:hypothetical protein